VLSLAKQYAPKVECHISTQASIVNYQSAKAWYDLGAKRVILARELNLDEIREIRAKAPKELEMEVFAHGAMCVSYSGRCLLSNYMTGRDSNRGACAQPCRWNYTYTITEEKRPETPMPLEEHEHGTFILSSKDMCTIEHIPELIASGIDSFKIEGRMKSAYYTAVVTNAYRMALDAYAADPENYAFDPIWLRELESVSHREYDTGFWFDRSTEDAKLSTVPGYLREKAYFATASSMEGVAIPEGVEAENEDGRLYLFLQRNKMCVGDAVELVSPRRAGVPFTAKEMYNIDGEPISSCPHPYMQFFLRVPLKVLEGDILRAGDGEK
jgi:putative protease